MIPGLRPWEVMKVEEVMDKVTYGKEWYRPILGSFTMSCFFFQEKWDGLYEDVQDTFANVDKGELIKSLKEAEKRR